MEIGTVLTATDTNPLYLEFVPLFIKSWSILFPEVDIIIVLIADSIPDILKEYSSNIRLVSPIPDMHTAFQAQCIRLLYPRYITREQGVLITDMDMIPLNRSYYEDPIKNIDPSAFVAYRNVLLPHEIPICYNIALPNTWKKVFETDTLESWYTEVNYDGNHGGQGWSSDQLKLIQRYNEYSGLKYILDDTIRMKRLDRSDILSKNKDEIQKNVINRKYSDYHCLRPYSEYKKLNDFIVECLLKPHYVEPKKKKFIWSRL
jgi:hypothetical protein